VQGVITGKRITKITIRATGSFLGTTDLTNFSATLTTPGIVTNISEIMEYTYTDECMRPLKLIWKNSLGGVEEQVFYYNHEISYAYPSSSKTKRYMLTAFGLTQAQFEAINELNSPDDVYKENILEVTEDTYRTDVKVNQQVYAVIDGITYGVIAIPTSIKRQTMDARCNVQVTIEVPCLI